MTPEHFRHFVSARDRSSRLTGRGVYSAPQIPTDLTLREWRVVVDWVRDYRDVHEAVRVFGQNVRKWYFFISGRLTLVVEGRELADSRHPMMDYIQWDIAVHRVKEVSSSYFYQHFSNPGLNLVDRILRAFHSGDKVSWLIEDAGKHQEQLKNFADLYEEKIKEALYGGMTSLWKSISLPSSLQKELVQLSKDANELALMWGAAMPVLVEKQGEV